MNICKKSLFSHLAIRWISMICLLLFSVVALADPWPVAEPESVGFQKDKLEKVAEYATENTGTTGLVVYIRRYQASLLYRVMPEERPFHALWKIRRQRHHQTG